MTPAPVIQGKEGAGYFVASKRTEGAYYLVYNDEDGCLTCTCPATVERCRHMREAAAWWAEQDRKVHAARHMPAAPAGNFVD